MSSPAFPRHLRRLHLLLDPGLAFGTGTHPTTALCLEWLDGQDLKDCNVLDRARPPQCRLPDHGARGGPCGNRQRRWINRDIQNIRFYMDEVFACLR